MTSIRLAHLEAAANAVVGLGLAQAILWAFGMPLGEAVTLNMVFLAMSYARSFVLRLVFRRVARSRAILRSALSEDVWYCWFGRLELDGLSEHEAFLSVPTKFLRSWISSH